MLRRKVSIYPSTAVSDCCWPSLNFFAAAITTAARFCASTAAPSVTASSDAAAASASSSSTSTTPLSASKGNNVLFVVVRRLRRLGEDHHVIRRACTNITNEDRLGRIALKMIGLHSQRLKATKELISTSRINVPKRCMLRWTLRRVGMQLYAERVKIRGIAVLVDFLVVSCILMGFAFIFSGFRGLSVMLRRMAEIELFTQNLMVNTIVTLEEHGNDGQMYMEAKQKALVAEKMQAASASASSPTKPR